MTPAERVSDERAKECAKIPNVLSDSPDNDWLYPENQNFKAREQHRQEKEFMLKKQKEDREFEEKQAAEILADFATRPKWMYSRYTLPRSKTLFVQNT